MPTTDIDRTTIQLTEVLKEYLKKEAIKAHRSLSAEIVMRLERSMANDKRRTMKST
jgi:hypothetical protein